MKIVVRHKRELPAAAKQFLEHCSDKRIFAFYGAMGAGKTTFIKALCEHLRSIDIVSSPTFTLVNEYKTETGESLYHIDFYRIKKHDEVFDFGIEEYLSGESYCFMEWPELVEDILPDDCVKVTIKADEDEVRTIELT